MFAVSCDHFVRTGVRRRGDVGAERLGGFEIDDRLQAAPLFERSITGFGALKEISDIPE